MPKTLAIDALFSASKLEALSCWCFQAVFQESLIPAFVIGVVKIAAHAVVIHVIL